MVDAPATTHEPSFPASGVRLDYLFVSPEDSALVKDPQVFHSKQAIIASDHCLVAITMDLEPRPTA